MGEVCVFQQTAIVADTGIIEEDIEPAFFGPKGREHRLPLIFIRHIVRKAARRAACFCDDTGGFCCGFRIEVRYNQFRPFPG